MKIEPMTPEAKAILDSTLEQLNAEWLAFQRVHKMAPKPGATKVERTSYGQGELWSQEDHQNAERAREPITVWR